jgi:hypothetical protein
MTSRQQDYPDNPVVLFITENHRCPVGSITRWILILLHILFPGRI